MKNDIELRLQKVRGRIQAATDRAERNPDEIKLVVVTKGQTIEAIQAAYNAGVRIFGENYVEEAKEKIDSLAFDDIAWHMIGHIQSRKAKDVVSYFTYIESVDSLKLATRLHRFLEEQNKEIGILLEVNAAGEETKNGWDISKRENWMSILKELREISEMPRFRIDGLMTMPPLEIGDMETRKNFRHVRDFRDFVQAELPNCNLSRLSMGTSSDFEIAIEEGATIIRLGTIIMGPRNYAKEAK
ncbi:MAG TPA: YggS family pyridoxal phosphate-dependent enzyme [Bellilinea sp.]|nr:YggS family pyridoxal phosphate-dependent enzyme [Bellilinea sp.]